MPRWGYCLLRTVREEIWKRWRKSCGRGTAAWFFPWTHSGNQKLLHRGGQTWVYSCEYAKRSSFLHYYLLIIALLIITIILLSPNPVVTVPSHPRTKEISKERLALVWTTDSSGINRQSEVASRMEGRVNRPHHSAGVIWCTLGYQEPHVGAKSTLRDMDEPRHGKTEKSSLT